MKYARIASVIWLTTGVVLLGIGITVGILWNYTLAPSRRLADPAWGALHSEKAVWIETQRAIRRFRWAHDDAGTVGANGREEWARDILADIEAGQNVFGCWEGHREMALERITNQGFGDDRVAWLAWWKTNQNRTQHEWVVQGFQSAGVQVKSPLDAATTCVLLAELGNTNRNETKHSGLKFNAYRWLRNHDFEPESVRPEDLTTADGAARLRGLVVYLRYLDAYPDVDRWPLNSARPPIASARYNVGAWAITILAVGLGVACVRKSGRCRAFVAEFVRGDNESRA